MAREPQPQTQKIKSYARTKGNVTTGQKRALTTGSSHLIPYSSQPLNCAKNFSNSNPVIMEIGFGMGYATSFIAQQNPHLNYLGVEVYEAGVGKLLMEIENRHLQNVKIIKHDVVEVLSMIEDHSLLGFHIFFPDPWPKSKHHKRRLLQQPLIHTLATKLQKEGYLYFVTDWQNYAEETFPLLQVEPLLQNCYNDYAEKQNWRPTTKFETKALAEGRSIYEMMFVKR